MRRFVILCFILVLFGCETISVKSKPQVGDKGRGVAYSTPIKVLTIEVSYVEQRTKEKIFGYEIENIDEIPQVIATQVTLIEELQADPRNIFQVDVDEIVDAGLFSATLDYKFQDNSLLNSVTSDFTDKKGEVIEASVGAAITLAKIIAIAGKEESKIDKLPDEIKPIGKRILNIYKELAKSDADLAPTGTAEAKKVKEGKNIRTQLNEELKSLQNTITYFLDNNKKTIVTSDPKTVRYTFPFDFNNFKNINNEYYEYTVNLGGLVQEVTEDFAPKINTKIFMNKSEIELTKLSLTDTDIDGFVYRLPKVARIVIEINNPGIGKFNSIDKYIGFPQLSPFFVVPAKSKSFTNRKTELLFSENTGSIIKFGSTTGSSTEEAMKTLKQSIDQIQTGLIEIRNAEREFENKILESKKAQVVAEKDYLKAKKELEDLKKEMVEQE